MARRMLTTEKLLFAVPLFCLLPVAVRALGKDALTKETERLAGGQAIDCGTSPMRVLGLSAADPQEHACMAEGISSGRGFRIRQELQPPVPRLYSGNYRANTIVCIPDTARARKSNIGAWHPAYLIGYECTYRVGVRSDEQVAINDRYECAVFGETSVMCGGK